MKNTSDHDLNTKSTNSLSELLQKITLTLELKSQEVENLFSSATRNLDKSLKSSNQFLNKEIDYATKSLLILSKISESKFKSYQTCSDQYNDEIVKIGRKFTEKIKSCTEKTVIGLETIRSNHESDLQEARDLKISTTRELKNFQIKKDNIKSCIDIQITTTNEKYKKILDKLQKASELSNKSVVELLKTANLCYENAQSQVTRALPEIIEKTKTCIEKSKVRLLICKKKILFFFEKPKINFIFKQIYF